MNILVTGGAGYIGSTLVPHLLQQHNVTVLDSLRYGGQGLLGVYSHPCFQFIKGDIRDQNAVRMAMADQDVVVHLAAIVGEAACLKTPESWEVNCDAMRLLLQMAQGARFIFASTTSAYGVTERGSLSDETTPLSPLDDYARAKVEAEKAVLAAERSVVLRFATVYGLSPRMRFDLMLNDFSLQAVTARWLLIHGPESWRTHVHVRDVACAVEYMMSQAVTGIVNIGGDNRTKRDLAEALLQLVPDLVVDYQERPDDPRDYQVDFDKAKRLGFHSRFTPEEGIQEIVNALRQGVFLDPQSGRYRN